MAKKEPVLGYWVEWTYPTGAEFAYLVMMTERDARRTEAFLEGYVGTGYLAAATVGELSGPMSLGELVQVFREEFPRTEKEWFPKK